MEQHEKNYLNQNTTRLLDLIEWNAYLTAHFIEAGIFTRPEIASLECIQNPLDRISQMMERLMKKVNGYATLVYALKSTNQTGAVALLNKIPASSVAPNMPTDNVNQPGGVYKVSFRQHNTTIKDAITKFQSPLVDKMKEPGTNTKIASQIQSLNYIDRDVMSRIVSDSKGDQLDRMNGLFDLIAELDDEEILNCLTQLCNLRGLIKISARLIKVFNEEYQGSVV